MRARLAAMCRGALAGTAMASPWSLRSTRNWVCPIYLILAPMCCSNAFAKSCRPNPGGPGVRPRAGITQRSDVLALGIDKYNEECRSIVMT